MILEIAGQWSGGKRPGEGEQKPSEPAQQQSEVIAGGGEHGIGAVAGAALEVIAADPPIGLEMADERFVHINEKSSGPVQK